jgi:hypothetical protein
MTRKQRSELLALRGWGPLLLEKIFAEVEKVIRKQEGVSTPLSSNQIHDDDVPLQGELPSDD